MTHIHPDHFTRTTCVEAVCRRAPKALVIATHLGSVNHALLTSDDVRDFALAHGLAQVCVLENGEIIEA